MAELLLKVGSTPSGWEDGDIIGAFNNRWIKHCHASNICHRRNAPRMPSGTIAVASLFYEWCNLTCTYRFERVSAKEYKRIVIATGEEEMFSDTPHPVTGEYGDVRLYVARRRAAGCKRMFGDDGWEIWFGGREYFDMPRLNAAWNLIETQTPFREQDHRDAPMGSVDLAYNLAVYTDDMTDAVANQLQESAFSLQESAFLRRKWKVNWQDEIPAADHAKVAERGKHYDRRGAGRNNRVRANKRIRK